MFISLNPGLPHETPMSFIHPSFGNILVYIGGKMPHWIKKFVNAFKNPGLNSEKRSIGVRGQQICLYVIEQSWCANKGHINKLRATRLTDEHFHINVHNCMQVHLVVQVLSMSVFNMITLYYKNNIKRLKEYKQLMMIVEKLNTIVDIWNRLLSKTFKYEPS